MIYRHLKTKLNLISAAYDKIRTDYVQPSIITVFKDILNDPNNVDFFCEIFKITPKKFKKIGRWCEYTVGTSNDAILAFPEILYSSSVLSYCDTYMQPVDALKLFVDRYTFMVDCYAQFMAYKIELIDVISERYTYYPNEYGFCCCIDHCVIAHPQTVCMWDDLYGKYLKSVFPCATFSHITDATVMHIIFNDWYQIFDNIYHFDNSKWHFQQRAITSFKGKELTQKSGLRVKRDICRLWRNYLYKVTIGTTEYKCITLVKHLTLNEKVYYREIEFPDGRSICFDIEQRLFLLDAIKNRYLKELENYKCC